MTTHNGAQQFTMLVIPPENLEVCQEIIGDKLKFQDMEVSQRGAVIPITDLPADVAENLINNEHAFPTQGWQDSLNTSEASQSYDKMRGKDNSLYTRRGDNLYYADESQDFSKWRTTQRNQANVSAGSS